MSGITRIQRSREDSRRPAQQDRPAGKEIWLKDGDQVFLTSLATGDENDTLLDELYLYTFRVAEWEEIEGPSGKKLFKEVVNDYRVVSLGFGRSDYIWNQLVDVYSDWGALNKGVMRIKRTGAGMYDTSYQISATPKKDEIPKDKAAEAKELTVIKEYFFERYGGFTAPSENGSSKEKDDELF